MRPEIIQMLSILVVLNSFMMAVGAWLHLRWMRHVAERFEITEKQVMKNIDTDVLLAESILMVRREVGLATPETSVTEASK